MSPCVSVQVLEEKVGAGAAETFFDPDWCKGQGSSLGMMATRVHTVANKSRLGQAAHTAQHRVGTGITVL